MQASQTSQVDIKGLDKVVLLKALWSAQRESYFKQVFDEKGAAEAVKKPIDYYCGRAIKMDLSQDAVDPRCYDRDVTHPNRKCREVVEEVRKGVKDFDLSEKSGPSFINFRRCAGCSMELTKAVKVVKSKKGRDICECCSRMDFANYL